MTTLSENYQWSKQKQPIIQGFINEQRRLVSSVAGNGFLLAPGHLYEYETDLEVDTKQKLSGISYTILKESVERDLKQYGLDMDISFKNSRMDWEIEKSTLLADWDRELAVIKQARESKEDLLNRLAVEVSKRGAVLISAKADIEIDMEELRGELAGIEDDSITKEIELVQQKLLTAQKKLEVIPILQEILSVEQGILSMNGLVIDKEYLVVGKEQEKIVALEGLISAETQVSTKITTDLIPVLQEETEAEGRLNTALTAATAIEELIYDEKISIAGMQKTKAESQADIARQEVITETKQLAIADIAIDKAYEKVAISEIEIEAMQQKIQLSEIEVEKSGKKVELLLKETEVEEKKLELADIAIEKSGLNVTLTEAETELASYGVEKADVSVDRSELLVGISLVEATIEGQNVNQEIAKLGLSQQKYVETAALLSNDNSGIVKLTSADEQSHTEVMNAERSVQSDWANKKTEVATSEIDRNVQSVDTKTLSNIDSIESSAGAAYTADIRIAETRAIAEVTAKLTHLIG